MKKQSIVVLGVSILIAIMFVGVYTWDNTKTEKININDVTENNMENIKVEIDSVQDRGDNYLVSGWAIEEGVTHEYFNWVCGKGESVYINNKIVLIDSNDNILGFNTVSQQRDDITSKINDGIDYKKCGINAVIDKKVLEEGNTYTIGVILTTVEDEEILVRTDKEIQK